MMMSLNQPETQALGSIADGLAGSDPRLASMLTIFSRLAAGEEMPAHEKTRGGGTGGRPLTVRAAPAVPRRGTVFPNRAGISREISLRARCRRWPSWSRPPAGPDPVGRWGQADRPCGICGLLSLWPLGRCQTGRVIPSVGDVPGLPASPMQGNTR